MTAKTSYRIAAVLLVLFAAGHTLGFLSLKPPSPEGEAVRQAMNSVRFEYGHGMYSYGGFYKGFGLTITAYLLFSACLAWSLSSLAAKQTRGIAGLAWAFVAVQAVCLVLSVAYFFLAPALFSGLVVVCLAWGAWRVRANG